MCPSDLEQSKSTGYDKKSDRVVHRALDSNFCATRNSLKLRSHVEKMPGARCGADATVSALVRSRLERLASERQIGRASCREDTYITGVRRH